MPNVLLNIIYLTVILVINGISSITIKCNIIVYNTEYDYHITYINSERLSILSNVLSLYILYLVEYEYFWKNINILLLISILNGIYYCIGIVSYNTRLNVYSNLFDTYTIAIIYISISLSYSYIFDGIILGSFALVLRLISHKSNFISVAHTFFIYILIC